MNLFGGNQKLHIVALEAAMATIGFDFSALAAKPDALKSFLDAKLGTARTEATAAAGTEFLKAINLAAVEGKSATDVVKDALAAKDATIGTYTAGLETAGVKATAADTKVGLVATDIKAAIEARSSQKGAAIAAAAGHTAIEQAAGGEGTTAKDLRERYQALVAAGKHAEAGRFFDQNAAAMYPASGSN